jgi:hypothetical protein
MGSEFTNSSISQEFHKGYILVGSWYFVIQELGIGYTLKGITVSVFVVKKAYFYNETYQ